MEGCRLLFIEETLSDAPLTRLQQQRLYVVHRQTHKANCHACRAKEDAFDKWEEQDIVINQEVTPRNSGKRSMSVTEDHDPPSTSNTPFPRNIFDPTIHCFESFNPVEAVFDEDVDEQDKEHTLPAAAQLSDQETLNQPHLLPLRKSNEVCF